MSIKLQAIVLVFIFCMFIFMLNQLRKNKLNIKYSLVWLFCFIGITIFTLFPKLLSKMSNILGIETPVYALFLISITVLTIICISLTIAVSRTNDRLRTLAQNIAIILNEKNSDDN